MPPRPDETDDEQTLSSPELDPQDVADLDALIQQARTAAESGEADPSHQAPEPAAEDRSPEEAPATAADEDEEDDQAEPVADTRTQEAGEAADAEGEPPKEPPRRPTRREAARLQEQLLQAEERTRQLSTEVERLKIERQEAHQVFRNLAGSDEEYEATKNKAANGDADAQERKREMDFWRKIVDPVYQEQKQKVIQTFAKGITQEVLTLPGLDQAGRERILNAASPDQAMRAAYDAGVTVAEKKSAALISRLRAKVAELETLSTANASQPAAGAGRAAATNQLDTLLEDGIFPTEEALAAARSGKLKALDFAPTR